MDQKLLIALSNIGDSLEALVEALKDKKESKSDTKTALVSGDFGKQLKSISAEIKSIKKDTQEILKNQKTLTGISKEKESEKGKVEEVTNYEQLKNVPIEIKSIKKDTQEILKNQRTLTSISKEKESEKVEEISNSNQLENIKKGVGTILLIAGAVLAIGLAFKIVGKVDFLSVVGLALAITIISIAFERITKLNIDPKKAINSALILTIISAALVLSSVLFMLIQPVSTSKLITAILIAGAFTLISFGLNKMLNTFKDVGIMQITKSVIFLPLILPAISLAIALSSSILNLITPISFTKALTAILIGALFSVISYGLKNILESFKDFKSSDADVARILLPIILPAMALSIAFSSWALQLVMPISFTKALTAIMISALFVILSFGLSKIIKSFENIKKDEIKEASWAIPLLFTSMSIAIAISSIFLQGVIPITFGQFLTAIGISLTFVVLSFAITIISKSIKNIDYKDLPKIPALFAIISAAIYLSSIILSRSDDIESEKLKNIAMLGGILAALVLIMIIPIKVLGKLNPKDLLTGGLSIMGISLVIMASSLILSVGNYEKYPNIDWITGVGISLLVFGLSAWALGASVFGPQALIFAAGLGAVLLVAGTILGVSKILKNGDFDYGSDLSKWADGVSKLYLTFTPILLILGTAALASSVLSVFGINPWKKARNAVNDVAKTIVNVSDILANGYTDDDGNKIKPSWKNGPTKEWAQGISMSIVAFSSIFGSIKNGINEDSINAIVTSMISLAKLLFDNSKYFNLNIDPNFIKNISQNMIDYNNLVNNLINDNTLSKLNYSFFGNDPISKIAKSMITLSKGYNSLADSLIRLSTAMKTLNISDIRQLGNITRIITNPNDITLNRNENDNLIENNKLSQLDISKSINIKSEKSAIDQKMDEIIKLLSNIDKSSSSIDSILQEMDSNNYNKVDSPNNFLSLLKSVF